VSDNSMAFFFVGHYTSDILLSSLRTSLSYHFHLRIDG